METLITFAGIGAFIGVGILVAIMALKKLLYICEPSEILVFSGRTRTDADGRKVGFRIITGGRAFRIPILEKVDRMDVSLISVPMTMKGAYSEGGIPLNLHAIANVKISDDPRLMGNAIERFLGHSRQEIGRVAKETLEGHLRGVLATMTPEEVNEDRLKFAETLTAEAGDDLRKLGLQLDTLKIQHVSDDRNYLDSIGRKRIAEIVRAAEVAESDAVKTAEEAEAVARSKGGVAMKQAQAKIQAKANELRQVKADLDARARAEEERCEAAAKAARAEAEKELQSIRGELEKIRLEADVTVPADINRQVETLRAAGRAAAIAENGKAVAQSLRYVAQAWEACGDRAMDLVMVQNLETMLHEVSATASELSVNQASLLDAGDGKALETYVRSYPRLVKSLLDEVTTTFGVKASTLLASENLDIKVEDKSGPEVPAPIAA